MSGEGVGLGGSMYGIVACGGGGGGSRQGQRVLYNNIYRQQTKLREGNVFTPVCHSVHKGGLCPGEVSVWGLCPGGSLSQHAP